MSQQELTVSDAVIQALKSLDSIRNKNLSVRIFLNESG